MSFRQTRRWRVLAARLKKDLPATCWMCADPIDLDAPRNSPGEWNLDHVVPVDSGIDPFDESNLRPSHRRCNLQKGISLISPERPKNSRRWG